MATPVTLERRVTPGQRIPMRWEDFWGWEPEGVRAEWVDGEAIIFMAPLTRHHQLTQFGAFLLRGFALVHGLGEVFSSDLGMDVPSRPSIRCPGVLFVRKENLHRVTREGLMGPADFVIEFISEDSVTNDRRDKFREHEQDGVPEYLMVDSPPGRERLTFYRLDADGRYQEVFPDAEGRFHSEVLPGFWFRAECFWQDPLPVVEQLLFLIAGDAYWRWLGAQREAVAHETRSE